MRRALIVLAGLAALLLAVAAVAQGEGIAQSAAGWQREFQNGMARTLRGLRAGEAGAWIGLTGLCFGYGFVHAVGPGHGKFLIGAYGAGRPVGFGRLAGATVAASMGQALTAVVLVLGGIGLLGLTRQQMTALAEGTLTRISLVSIIALGAWVLARGLRRAWAMRADARHGHDGRPAGQHGAHDHPHPPHAAHDHHHPGATCGCGHAHAPTPAEVAAATTPRELASLIAAIAIRPCSGAILLLILSWQMGILAAGIAGAFAMAAGTATLTLIVAAMATGIRSGALAGIADARATRIAAAGFEVAAGLAVILLAAQAVRLT